jgi:TusA-related sulfurtransferase
MDPKLEPEQKKELEEEIIDLRDRLRSGRIILKFIVDHPPSTKSIPREAKKSGYQTEIEKTGAAEWVITVKK